MAVPQGGVLAIALADRSLNLYDVQAGGIISRRVFNGEIKFVEFRAGKLFVGAGEELHIFDSFNISADQVHEVIPVGPIGHMCFVGNLLYVADNNNNIDIWDTIGYVITRKVRLANVITAMAGIETQGKAITGHEHGLVHSTGFDVVGNTHASDPRGGTMTTIAVGRLDEDGRTFLCIGANNGEVYCYHYNNAEGFTNFIIMGHEGRWRQPVVQCYIPVDMDGRAVVTTQDAMGLLVYESRTVFMHLVAPDMDTITASSVADTSLSHFVGFASGRLCRVNLAPNPIAVEDIIDNLGASVTRLAFTH